MLSHYLYRDVYFFYISLFAMSLAPLFWVDVEHFVTIVTSCCVFFLFLLIQFVVPFFSMAVCLPSATIPVLALNPLCALLQPPIIHSPYVFYCRLYNMLFFPPLFFLFHPTLGSPLFPSFYFIVFSFLKIVYI